MRSTFLASLLVLAAIPACGDSPTESPRLTKKETLVGNSGDLVQTITLDPANPAPGQNITIRSVIANRGKQPVELASRICELDYDGSLELAWPPEVAKCRAYSTMNVVAPGDSIVGHDIMRIASSPGSYQLKVRHALDPEAWVNLDVEVRRP